MDGAGAGGVGGGCFLLPGNIPLQRCGCVCNASVWANMRASGVHFFVYSGEGEGGMAVISMWFVRLWEEVRVPNAGRRIRAPQWCPAIKALQTKEGRHFKDPIRPGLVAHISLAHRSHKRRDEEEPFVNLYSAIRHLLSFFYLFIFFKCLYRCSFNMNF